VGEVREPLLDAGDVVHGAVQAQRLVRVTVPEQDPAVGGQPPGILRATCLGERTARAGERPGEPVDDVDGRRGRRAVSRHG